jgi:hypothetical protein
MYAKLINPKSHGLKAYDNSGSAARAVNYLTQEKRENDEQATFFGAKKDGLTGEEVMAQIDNNVKGLRADDAKFYSLVLSPSEEELAHLGANRDEQLKAYTREVMQLYAANFNLKDGKKLGSEDLVWAAVIHQDRAYRGTDAEVIAGEKKAGEKKEGEQTHVHIIVSARDAEQKITLNPGGRADRFSLKGWQTAAGRQFEQQFGYEGEHTKGPHASRRTGPERDPEAAMARRSEKLVTRVEALNAYLPKNDQLDAARVVKIAKEREFDLSFYRLMGKVEHRAHEGQPMSSAATYQLLETGREAKPVTLSRSVKQAGNTLQTILRSSGDRRQEQMQDLRDDQERKRDNQIGY